MCNQSAGNTNGNMHAEMCAFREAKVLATALARRVPWTIEAGFLTQIVPSISEFTIIQCINAEHGVDQAGMYGSMHADKRTEKNTETRQHNLMCVI